MEKVKGEDEVALRLLKHVLHAHQQAPLEEMEKLVTLAAEDGALRTEIFDGTSEVLAADPASLVPCWLSLIVGELGPEGRTLLLSALGTSEGEALDQTLIPVLTRHAPEVFGVIASSLDDADPDEEEYRSSLYLVLEGIAAGDDAAARERLRAYALRRLEVERALPREFALVSGPLFLLAALGHPETRDLLASVRDLQEGREVPGRGLDDVDHALAGEDVLAPTRRILAHRWRDTASHVEGLFRGAATV